MARSVPRNIDKPNRNAEFAFAFLFTHYSLMFAFGSPWLSLTAACFTVYLVNRLTIDKPEGQAYRLFYRFIKFGQLIPSATFVKRFEV